MVMFYVRPPYLLVMISCEQLQISYLRNLPHDRKTNLRVVACEGVTFYVIIKMHVYVNLFI